MQWTDKIRQVKILLIIVAVIIAVGSLLVSNWLVRDLQREEQGKMRIWAEALHQLNQADIDTDLSLVLSVMEGNNTIPVIVLDANDEVMDYRNISVSAENAADSLSEIQSMGRRMRNEGQCIRIETGKGKNDFQQVCYAESNMLRRLYAYPYIQLLVVLIFVGIAIFALLSSKRAEQNKVWVGLSKETAHQLGTPISSLMAWTEILRENHPDDELLPDMEQDVKRLQLIAERFSKIGSLPELKPSDVGEMLQRVVKYMERRTSQDIKIECRFAPDIIVPMNTALFEWVVENLCKNAVDAMDGAGRLTLVLLREGKKIVIEVSDTGRGIRKKDISSVFTPGFTTKKRGWGLGLSLAKRIVEDYHKGRIFVKSSEQNVGTTFRIEL